MFGTNVVSKPDFSAPKALRVQDVFYTMQGEGPYSGRAAVFIRLAGCNLRCHWCDTPFDDGLTRPARTPEELVNECESLWPMPPTGAHNKLVVLTGGEPLRQELTALLLALRSSGWGVQIETAGTVVSQHTLRTIGNDPGIRVVISPKTPKVHEGLAAFCYDWKYVVGADDLFTFSGIPITNTQAANGTRQALAGPATGPCLGKTIWASPRDDQDLVKNEANVAAAVEACLRYGHRLSLQVHKIVRMP